MFCTWVLGYKKRRFILFLKGASSLIIKAKQVVNKFLFRFAFGLLFLVVFSVDSVAITIGLVYVNYSPTSVTLSNSELFEDAPINTKIGELLAEDLDGSSYTFLIYHEIVFETNGYNYQVKVDGEYLSKNNPDIDIIDGHVYKISHQGNGHPIAIWNDTTSLLTLSSGESYELDTTATSISGLEYVCIYHSSMAGVFNETTYVEFAVSDNYLISKVEFVYEDPFSYELTVQATDVYGNSVTDNILVAILDAEFVFDEDSVTFNLDLSSMQVNDTDTFLFEVLSNSNSNLQQH